ncbi:PSD1 and planctomycete cytochrome C domain-containing protein [Pirellulaceae bacterium]|jgi:hypothetical protein|nr:PSD1 and planctomycete cytochrome C domain-containing protein [Pirellulaceae bacterium]
MAFTKFYFSLISCFLATTSILANDDQIRFSRDVLPLLSDRCFHCHGPDETHREADLRLDLEASAVGREGSAAPILRHDAKHSEFIQRISSDDPDLKMPPPGSNRKSLSPKEVDTLKRWVQSGANWGKHWSFESPRRPVPPTTASHPIDAFIQRQLKNRQWKPAKPAEPATLIRRLSFDLNGLPPTWSQVSQFEANPTPAAYEKQVDQILNSPHFGERMAMWWLDAARYADTDGYQGDATRNNWPWRDWVVNAFNTNMPFDQFTIEQFAGDLLPNATAEQKLATSFHRHHMTNGEGGRHPEESRIDYVIDRVNTMGTVWLGLTLGCTQCHTHKFDPVSHQDYYSLFAFFNSIDEDGRAGGGAKPFLRYKSKQTGHLLREAEKAIDLRRVHEMQQLEAAKTDFLPWLKRQLISTQDGFKGWHVAKPSLVTSAEGTTLVIEPDGMVRATGLNPNQDEYRSRFSSEDLGNPGTHLRRVTGLRLEVFPHSTHTDGKLSRGRTGEFILTDVKLQVQKQGKSQVIDLEFSKAIADVEKKVAGRNYGKVNDTLDDDPRNGWTTETHDPLKSHVAIYALREPLILTKNDELIFVMLQRSTRGDANIGQFRISFSDQPGSAVRSLDPMPLERLAQAKPQSIPEIDAELKTVLLNQFLDDHDRYQASKAQLRQAKNQLSQLKKASGDLNVMVLSERSKPRQTHVLQRGVWDQKGETVSHRFPERIFNPKSMSSDNRLDLAKWLVHRKNPLTARVLANHLWQICLGEGLVRTPDDFGLQGEFPTHPDLLDWLAVELMENNWDIKHLLKVIVTSQTYRQSSAITAKLQEQDPDNRLIARASRYRLPSWMIRDAALRSSGLLNYQLGGPTVLPYQPDGIWAEMFMGRFRYQPSPGNLQFRRTIYAFWRRSAAPTFLFDSSQRRLCEVKPRRTNTPLHALTLLNDLSLLEASRALAKRSITENQQPQSRIPFLFRQVLSRDPTPDEQQLLVRQLELARSYYNSSPEQARQFLDFGQLENKVTNNHVEIAAYMIVANLVFNLDEAISRE